MKSTTSLLGKLGDGWVFSRREIPHCNIAPSISLCQSVHPQLKWYWIFTSLSLLHSVALSSEANSVVAVSTFQLSCLHGLWSLAWLMMPREHYVTMSEFHSSTIRSLSLRHVATALTVCSDCTNMLQGVVIMAVQKISLRQQSVHKDGSPGNNRWLGEPHNNVFL